jgi:hypothetical protein
LEAFQPPVTKRGRNGGKGQSTPQEQSKKEVSSKGKKGAATAKVVKPGKAAKGVRAIKAAAKRKRAGAKSADFADGDQDD